MPRIDFVVSLFRCEGRNEKVRWDDVLEALGIVSLVFSCLFMMELVASIWAFGWQYAQSSRVFPAATNPSRYFRSWFHRFDAMVIVAAFVLDVLLRGVLEEAASLIVILRLWRVFKIIEELSVGAQEQIEGLEDTIEELKGQTMIMGQEITHLKQRLKDTSSLEERHSTPPTPD